MKTIALVRFSAGVQTLQFERRATIRAIEMTIAANGSSGGDEGIIGYLYIGGNKAVPGASGNFEGIIAALAVAADFQSAASYWPMHGAVSLPGLAVDVAEFESVTFEVEQIVGTMANPRCVCVLHYEFA